MDRAARRARGGQRCASSPGMQTTVPFPMVLRYSRGVLATAAAAAPAVAVAWRVWPHLLEQGRLIVGRIAPLLARDLQQRAADLDLVRRLRVHLCAHFQQLPEGGVAHA